MHQLFEVVDLADRDDRIGAEPRTDDQRLVFVIADDADAGRADEFIQIVVEFGAELRVGDVVDAPDDFPLRRRDGHSAALGPEVRMVINAVKQVADAIRFGRYAEKTAHIECVLVGFTVMVVKYYTIKKDFFQSLRPVNRLISGNFLISLAYPGEIRFAYRSFSSILKNRNE